MHTAGSLGTENKEAHFRRSAYEITNGHGVAQKAVQRKGIQLCCEVSSTLQKALISKEGCQSKAHLNKIKDMKNSTNQELDKMLIQFQGLNKVVWSVSI